MSLPDSSSISTLEDATGESTKGANHAPPTEEQPTPAKQQQQPQLQQPRRPRRRSSKDDADIDEDDAKHSQDADAAADSAPVYSIATYPAANSPTLGCVL